MTTSEKTSQRDILARQLAEVFRADGYEGASMARLSEATGLLRGSLYHHFPKGKDDMAKAAMDALGAEVERLMFAPLRGEGKPREKLGQWAAGVEEIYVGGKKKCIFGSMMLSGGATRFQPELKQTFSDLITALVAVLIEAGISQKEAQYRAQSAIERIQGALIVANALDDCSGFHRLIEELPDTLLTP
ncbi:MAG: TetR/AcrR family transcriptional regulator [Chloroflexota bacterium]